MKPDIKQLPLGPLQTNCYFLGCTETKQAAIIDPSDNGQALADFISENGYTLTHILLTHSHFDHVGGLGDLKNATAAPIYAHEDAIPFLKNAVRSAARFGLPMEPQPDPDHFLVEGDVVNIGNLTLEVLFTPGHAPGHLSFYLRDHAVVFDGDVLFQGSIGRTDLPGSDFSALMNSIEEKLMPLPDETHVLSGHGNPTTIGRERTTNPFLQ